VTGEPSELLAAAAYATRAAGKLLAGVRPSAIRAKDNPTDLVTEWDTRAEDCIRAALAEVTPGVPVLGEEGGQGEGGTASGLRWVVDPIDGTVNFAHGLPIWAISIACERVGEGVLAGVVFAPVLGWWFEASRGGGARDENGAPLQVSQIPSIASALLTTGFPYDRATSPHNNFAQWEHMQRRAGACRRLGAASLDLCLVARGWLDGYWERRLKAWDVAAGALIVVEAGGRVTDTRGGPFDSHAGEVVATNGAIHEELVVELGRVATEKP
jgi:myo-inositol-1(or 4)-monophosphatase